MPHAAGRLLSTYNYRTKRQIGAVGQNRIDSRFIKIDSDPIYPTQTPKAPHMVWPAAIPTVSW